MNLQKNIGILADITFDLILKEFKADIPQHVLFSKYEDIATALMTQAEELRQTDFLLIHCETIFNRYEKEQVRSVINAVEYFAREYKGTLILSGFTFFHQHTDLSVLPVTLPPSLKIATNVLFVDYGSLVADEGLKNAYHYPLGHLYQMPFTKGFIKKWAAYLKEYFIFLDRQEKKVIVLDCDNTLWGGIIGEDGPDKVRINKNADGILFLHFQQWLKQKAAEGFLLCLCSKNNEEDVRDFFSKGGMPLKWEDFVLKKVNWEDKHTNLKALAKELNLGMESFIFIDDNEFEVESVHTLLPEIASIHFQNDYMQFLEITKSFLFKRKHILQEDKDKQQKYLEEQQREASRTEGSFEDYITSLQIVTEMQVNEEQHLERYAQMTEKTNQFNFNKTVYTPVQLKQFIAEGNYLFGVKVSDRFGDYGIVGLIMAKVNKNENTSMVHNFLMSCRALGRGVEEDFYRQAVQFLEKKGLDVSGIEFIETAKNQPAKSFYEQLMA